MSALLAEWQALGEAGQALVMLGLPGLYMLVSVVMIWWATREAQTVEVTDADHFPAGEWIEIHEAQMRAEKESQNG